LTVEYVLKLLAQGAAVADILAEYEGLTPEDVQACLLFATRARAYDLLAVDSVEADVESFFAVQAEVLLRE
jgi:uncharacterized protein (DUF433 family)